MARMGTLRAASVALLGTALAAAAGVRADLLAANNNLGGTTCTFAVNQLTCALPGENCCSNNNQYIAVGGANTASYVPAACKVTFGDGTRECGKVMSVGSGAATLDMAYGSACSNDPITSPYPCQYVDPTQIGEEQYPDLLQCDRGLKTCLLDATQITGDPCSQNAECASGQCRNGVCQGLPVGAACTAGGCAPGLYCHIPAGNGSATCMAAVKPGGLCGMLSACGPGYVCNLASNRPTCIPLFSQPNGVVVNTPDACTTGLTDLSNKCAPAVEPTLIGTVCDGSIAPNTPGSACFCASSNQYRLRPHTLRSAAMVAARMAARQCFATATAPDGTPCGDPWANLGVGRRISEIGTCGWFRCHDQIMAYEASEADTIRPPLQQFDHDPQCGQAAMLSYYAAAGAGQIGCYMPAAFRAAGWKCNSEESANTGMTGGQKFGVAVAVLLPMGLIGYAAFALYTGKAPSWLKRGADTVSGATSSAWSKVTGRGGNYGRIGASTSTATSSSFATSASSSGSYGSSAATPLSAGAYQ